MPLSTDQKDAAFSEFCSTGLITCPSCAANPQKPKYEWMGQFGYSLLLNCRNKHTHLFISIDDPEKPNFHDFSEDEKDAIEASYRQTGQAECPHCAVSLQKFDTPPRGACMLYCPLCSQPDPTDLTEGDVHIHPLAQLSVIKPQLSQRRCSLAVAAGDRGSRAVR
jgi:hypothetical protein